MALAICGYTFLGILVIALGITLPIVLPRNLQAAMITTGVLAPFCGGKRFHGLQRNLPSGAEPPLP